MEKNVCKWKSNPCLISDVFSLHHDGLKHLLKIKKKKKYFFTLFNPIAITKEMNKNWYSVERVLLSKYNIIEEQNK